MQHKATMAQAAVISEIAEHALNMHIVCTVELFSCSLRTVSGFSGLRSANG